VKEMKKPLDLWLLVRNRLVQRFASAEQPVPFSELKQYCGRGFAFDCETSKRLLAALRERFPENFKLAKRGILISAGESNAG